MNCRYCGETLPKRPPSKSDRPFCTRACFSAWQKGRNLVEKTARNRIRRIPEHPLAPKSGLVAVSRAVLYDKIGPGAHSCHWCGESVTWRIRDTRGPRLGDLVADHLNWDINDDSPENLVPACLVCNVLRTKKGDRAAIRKDELSMMWGGYLTRAVQRFCVICGTSFLSIPAEVKKGKGLYCSRSCAGKGRMLNRQQ